EERRAKREELDRSRHRSRMPRPYRPSAAAIGHQRPRSTCIPNSSGGLRRPSAISGQATGAAPDRKAGGSIPSRRTTILNTNPGSEEAKFGPDGGLGSQRDHKFPGSLFSGWPAGVAVRGSDGHAPAATGSMVRVGRGPGTPPPWREASGSR